MEQAESSRKPEVSSTRRRLEGLATFVAVYGEVHREAFRRWQARTAKEGAGRSPEGL